MKRCPICKTKLNGSFSTCPVCGYNPNGKKSDLDSIKNFEKSLEDFDKVLLNGSYPRPPRNWKKGLLITAACLGGAAVVAGSTYGVIKAVEARQDANAQEFKVKFLNDDGEILLSKRFKKGTDLSLISPANPVKKATDEKNYQFKGWDPEIRPGDKLTEDCEFKAIYEEVDINDIMDATPTGGGACAVSWNKNSSYQPKHLVVPETMEIAGSKYKVTAIKAATVNATDTTGAFEGCQSLETLTIPSTIKEIDKKAFKDCSNLKKVIIENIAGGLETISDYAFYNCSSLSSVTFNNGIKVIGTYAFANCNALTTIELPASIEEINTHAFDCGDLTDVGLVSATFLGDTAGKDEYWSINNFSYVASSASENAKRLKGTNKYHQWTHIHNPYVASYLGFNILNDTECSVKSVSGPLEKDLIIPETYNDVETGKTYKVVAVEGGAFETCLVKSIELPETVTTIGSNAFSGCSNLESINLENVTKLGSGAFQNCTSLTKVELNDKIKAIPEACFYRSGIKSIELPASCKDVGKSAFDSCGSLATVTLNSKLERIDTYGFAGTRALKSIEIPSSVRKIGTSAFYNSAITELKLNAGLKVLGANCFRQCTGLTSVEIPATVDTLYGGCFYGTSINNLKFVDTSDNYQVLNIDRTAEGGYRKGAALTSIKSQTFTNYLDLIFKQYSDIHVQKQVFNLKYTESIDGFLRITNPTNDYAECSILLTDSIGSLTESIDLVIPSTYFYNKGTDDTPEYVLSEITEFVSNDNHKTAQRQAINSVEFSPTLRTLGVFCLYNCINVSNYNIPVNITSIMQGAFGYNAKQYESILNYLYIPSTVTQFNPLGNTCDGTGEIYSNLLKGGLYFEDPSIGWAAYSFEGYDVEDVLEFTNNPITNLEKATEYRKYELYSELYDLESTISYETSYSCRSNTNYLYPGDRKKYIIDLDKLSLTDNSYISFTSTLNSVWFDETVRMSATYKFKFVDTEEKEWEINDSYLITNLLNTPYKSEEPSTPGWNRSKVLSRIDKTNNVYFNNFYKALADNYIQSGMLPAGFATKNLGGVITITIQANTDIDNVQFYSGIRLY